jgi:hypothetical protein
MASIGHLVAVRGYKIKSGTQWVKATYSATDGMYVMGHTTEESEATTFHMEHQHLTRYNQHVHSGHRVRIYFIVGGVKQYVTFFKDIKNFALYSLDEEKSNTVYAQALGNDKVSHAAHFHLMPVDLDELESKEDLSTKLETGKEFHLVAVHPVRGLLGRGVGIKNGEISEERDGLSAYVFVDASA